MIALTCPGCRRQVEVKGERGESTSRCPHCGGPLPVPQTTAPPNVRRPSLGAGRPARTPPAASRRSLRSSPASPGAETQQPIPASQRETEAPRGSTPEGAPGSDAAASLPKGPSVPGYEILGELGRGGMGVVYKARQVALKRTVALKMILAGGFAGSQELARFRTEAEAVARLQHPNIVQVFEVGEAAGHPFFSLEICTGGNLAQKLKGEPMPPVQAARLVEVLARAMDAAHRAGVVHRDLKPANVLITGEGRLKITDFGLAKKLDGGTGQTASGAIMGTPGYMAPEQAGGRTKAIGPAADIYGLGAILYELLTGRPPFQADTPLDTLLQVISDEPVPPSQRQPQTPKDLETVCLKCLHKEPANRYASARTLAADLRRFLAGTPVLARSVGRGERVWRWCRRNPLAAGLGAAVAALLLVGLAGSGSVAWHLQAMAEREREAVRAQILAQEEAGRQREQADAARRAAEQARDEARREEAHPARHEPEPPKPQEAVPAKPKEPDPPKPPEPEAHVPAPPALPAAFRLLPLEKVTVYPGKSITVAVVLDRNGCQGPVVVTLDGLPRGVSALPAIIAADKDRVAVELTAAADALVATATGRVRAVFGDRKAEQPLSVALTRPVGEVCCLVEPSKGGMSTWASGDLVVTSNCIIDAVALSPDGSRALTYAHRQYLRLWDLKTGKEIRRFFEKLDPDDQQMMAAVPAQQRQEWLKQNRRGPDLVSFLAFSPDGHRAISVADRETIVWNVETGAEAFRLKGGNVFGTQAAVFSLDGRTLLTNEDSMQTFRFSSALTGKEVGSCRYRKECLAVAFAADGKNIVGGGRSEIFVCDPTGKELRQFNLRGGVYNGVDSMVFSADGRRALTLDRGTPMRLLDLEAMKELLTLPKDEGATCVAISPDGRLALSGDWQGTLRLWDLETGKERRRFDGHAKMIKCVVFARDSRHALSAGWDGTARLWDLSK